MGIHEAVRATIYLDAVLHQALQEDQEDLAVARLRAAEPRVSYEDFLDRLKADGTL